jgi:hypothetical protein
MDRKVPFHPILVRSPDCRQLPGARDCSSSRTPPGGFSAAFRGLVQTTTSFELCLRWMQKSQPSLYHIKSSLSVVKLRHSLWRLLDVSCGENATRLWRMLDWGCGASARTGRHPEPDSAAPRLRARATNLARTRRPAGRLSAVTSRPRRASENVQAFD